MAIIDYPGLQYWLSTAYMLYMFQENDSGAGSTNVALGTPVGQMEDQAPLVLTTGIGTDGERPTYTNEISANAYIQLPTAASFVVRNSTGSFKFINEAPRIWTIAFKIRFVDASASSTESILGCAGGSAGNVGFFIQRRLGNFIRFRTLDGSNTASVEINTSTLINDNLWHDIIITSAGDGANDVSVEIDGTPATGTYGAVAISDGTSFADLTFGSLSSGAQVCECDISDFLIMDQVMSAGDKTDYRATNTFPNMNAITPGGGGFGALIRSQKASLTAGLLSARGVGG